MPDGSHERRIAWVWITSGLIALLGVGLAYWYVEPAPPRKIVIATGVEGGGYATAAESYARIFARNGVELEILHTGGSLDNYRLLQEGQADLAIVQSGTVPDDVEGLQSIAAVYHEPLLIFHRAAMGELNDPTQLEGTKVSLGEPGSGTFRLARGLMAEMGVDAISITPPADPQAALESGEVDAVFLVMSPTAPLVRGLLQDPAVRLMSLRRAEAIARRDSALQSVVLPEGASDLSRNVPNTRVDLVAPTAVLISREDTHSAAVLLAAMAAQETHRGATLLSDPGDFPEETAAELPISSTASHYFRNGPTFLKRVLPFWASSFVERAIIVLVPMLALLFPIIRATPPLYRWRIRSRIYRWYAELREIDAILTDESDEPAWQNQRERLAELEREAQSVTVPLSYMEEFYNLRLHIDYLRRRLDRAADHDGDEKADGIATADQASR
jgi:TRAP transporter TAXI family solute receptor